MNRTKVKKTKVLGGIPGGQKNISSFFPSKNQKDLSSILAFNKAESQNKDGVNSLSRLHSPLKKRVLRDLKNQLASSPDLISVPETPDSQIRQTWSSPSKDASQRSPEPSSTENGCLSKLGQLSPICHSPCSKGPSIRRRMTEKGGRSKRTEGYSTSMKRLFSPPKESFNAKRERTESLSPPENVISPTGSSLNVTGTLKTPQISSHQSADQSESTQNVTPALEGNLKNGQADQNEGEIPRTSLTEANGSKTDKEQAKGAHVACYVLT
ncbi:uncharacterized protein KZ484_026191 [Pholidichthys leucotaenia]